MSSTSTVRLLYVKVFLMQGVAGSVPIGAPFLLLAGVLLSALKYSWAGLEDKHVSFLEMI